MSADVAVAPTQQLYSPASARVKFLTVISAILPSCLMPYLSPSFRSCASLLHSTATPALDSSQRRVTLPSSTTSWFFSFCLNVTGIAVEGHCVSCVIENQYCFHHCRCQLTIDDDCGSCLYVIASAAIHAAVFGQRFPDKQLQRRAALPRLVLLSMDQHTVALLPLHPRSYFGDLAAESHIITFLHLDVLQLLKEFNRSF